MSLPTELAKARWLRQQSSWSVLRHVVRVLEGEGIAVLPVKGVLTSALLYDSPPDRLGDIDLLVRRRQFAPAERCAKRLGWSGKPEPALWQATWHVQDWEVDVKGAMGPAGLCALSADDLFMRAVRATEPLGFRHWQIETNDHALLLAVEAFKDGLRGARWSLEDLRRIAAHRAFDPARLIARARTGRVLSALWIVADWLGRHLGACAWTRVRDGIGPRPPSPRVSRAYRAWLECGRPPKVGLFVIAGASDGGARSLAGLGIATAGILRSRALRLAARRHTS